MDSLRASMAYLIHYAKLHPEIAETLNKTPKGKDNLYVCEPMQDGRMVAITPFETWLLSRSSNPKPRRNFIHSSPHK